MSLKRLISLRAELKALRTLCLNPDSRASQFLLSKLAVEHFATGIGRAAFQRIQRYLKKDSAPPDWDELVTDPGLDQSVRDALVDCELTPVESKKSTAKLFERIEEYRKLRMLVEVGKTLEKNLKSPDPIDTDKLITEIQNKTAGINRTVSYKMVHIGQNSNVRKHIRRLLSGTAIHYIPTGFEGFDSVNRGIPDGACWIIGGETGAGKSILVGQIANNMAQYGAKVAFVPLEMSNDEVLQRDLSRKGNANMTDLLDPQNKLSKKQRQEIEERFMAHDERTARRGGRISYVEFDADVSLETALATLKPFEYDVIIIDYIGLLEGLSGDDQWRAMTNASRYAKIWAKTNKCRVVLAAQLSEEGLLRYARGIKENASFFWHWRNDEHFKATGVAEMMQGKARQASDHSFYLYFDKPKMTVKDASAEDMDHRKKFMEKNGKRRGGKKGSDDGDEESGRNRRRWENSDDGMSWDEDDAPSEPKAKKKEVQGKPKQGRFEKKHRRESVEL